VLIALHLQVEDFRLSRGGRRYEVGVKKSKDAIADGAQLLLKLGPGVLDRSDVLLVSFTSPNLVLGVKKTLYSEFKNMCLEFKNSS